MQATRGHFRIRVLTLPLKLKVLPIWAFIEGLFFANTQARSKRTPAGTCACMTSDQPHSGGILCRLHSFNSCLMWQHTVGTLPMEPLITVLGFLANIRDIATCACVSRLWAKAAGPAVSRIVNVLDDSLPKMAYLLKKPHLGGGGSVSGL